LSVVACVVVKKIVMSNVSLELPEFLAVPDADHPPSLAAHLVIATSVRFPLGEVSLLIEPVGSGYWVIVGDGAVCAEVAAGVDFGTGEEDLVSWRLLDVQPTSARIAVQVKARIAVLAERISIPHRASALGMRGRAVSG
jgi:hypothetical protein